jgi:hypothetical protein
LNHCVTDILLVFCHPAAQPIDNTQYCLLSDYLYYRLTIEIAEIGVLVWFFF